MDTLYYCVNEGNTCDKKDTCKRYIQAENNCSATLFKRMCTVDNNYILYIHQLNNINTNECIDESSEEEENVDEQKN